jgi:hypothetical protein
MTAMHRQAKQERLLVKGMVSFITLLLALAAALWLPTPIFAQEGGPSGFTQSTIGSTSIPQQSPPVIQPTQSTQSVNPREVASAAGTLLEGACELLGGKNCGGFTKVTSGVGGILCAFSPSSCSSGTTPPAQSTSPGGIGTSRIVIPNPSGLQIGRLVTAVPSSLR